MWDKASQGLEVLGGAGSAAAEEYAWNRFEIDAVGKGWYCPYPQRWKEISKQVSKNRAAKYKAEADRRKKEHQIAYALREQEALKAAAPRTPPRPRSRAASLREKQQESENALPPDPSGEVRDREVSAFLELATETDVITKTYTERTLMGSPKGETTGTNLDFRAHSLSQKNPPGCLRSQGSSNQ